MNSHMRVHTYELVCDQSIDTNLYATIWNMVRIHTCEFTDTNSYVIQLIDTNSYANIWHTSATHLRSWVVSCVKSMSSHIHPPPQLQISFQQLLCFWDALMRLGPSWSLVTFVNEIALTDVGWPRDGWLLCCSSHTCWYVTVDPVNWNPYAGLKWATLPPLIFCGLSSSFV